jgi:glycosyltransferase involved in cell wall biosynthesis
MTRPRVVAVTMVKDEADIVGYTVRHMATQVDHVLVADNMSTDDTRPILDRLAGVLDNVTVIDDPDPAYEQSRKMTDLATRARLQFNAEWVIPFDADEIWYWPFGTVADCVADLAPQWLVVNASLYNHFVTALDRDDPDPIVRMGWRDYRPAPLPKVACRWRRDLTIQMGNHGATYRGGATVHPERRLVVRHYPYRSVEQLVRKVRNGAAAYKLTDHDETVGAHWRQWGRLLDADGEEAIAELFNVWYFRDAPESLEERGGMREALPRLLYDPAPI